MLRIFTIIFMLGLAMPAVALAQDTVRARAGDHEAYSRLVLDWDTRAAYTLSRPDPGLVTLTFERAATIPDAEIAQVAARNIGGVSVASESPFTLSLSVPSDAKIRDFYAGNRVVVDVYDSASQAKPETLTQSSAKPKEMQVPLPDQSALSAPGPEASPENAQGQKTLTGTLERLGVAGAADTPKKPLAPKVKLSGDNLVTVSSTSALNLAVFVRGGDIWLLTDRSDLVLSPQVSGPDSKKILPVQTEKAENATIYRVTHPEGAQLKAQGGGLVWRVIVSDQKNSNAPVLPVREKAPDTGMKMVWAFKGKMNLVDVKDPVTGRMMTVVVTEDAEQFSGPAAQFIDFDTLYTAAGLVIVPNVDDLEIAITDRGIEVSRPGGLNVLAQEFVDRALADKNQDKGSKPSDGRTIFNFESWALGGPGSLQENKNILMAGMGVLDQAQRVQGLITLAKMFLANGQWAETQGMLRVAEQELPDLARNPEFIALKGAAKALGYDSEGAFEILSDDVLKQYDEIGYWRSFTLADLGDWQQAAEVLPKSTSALQSYTPVLQNRLGLVLSEVALRDGKVAFAESLLAVVEMNKDTLFAEQAAALAYLQGELARQKNKKDDTIALWEPLTKGSDDLYRAKAGLALTRLLVNEKKIDNAKAIDNLERLRYAWRGDELEAQINYWLGKTYFERKDFVKGLGIMRDAATMAAGTVLGRRITAEMAEIFTNLFLGEDLNAVTPLDAAALHEQFSELLPTGDQGNKVIERLAEHLVQADLPARAAELLQRQVDHRLQGFEAYRTAMRLAAIYLLDENPKRASQTLAKARKFFEALPAEMQTAERRQDMALLEARTLSQSDRSDQAMVLLNDMEPTPPVNLLRADIAWNAGYWDDAAMALDDVIRDKNFSLTRPLSPENAMLVLQRAVALNLSGDRVGLANVRERYSDAMAQTDKARIFEVITRPRQSAALADRETLMSIVSEVDLFGEFLNSFTDGQAAPSN